MSAWLAGRGGEVPAEEFEVTAVAGPGEQVDDDGLRVGDVPLASGVVEIAVESGEGGQSAAGIGDAPDDIGGLGGLVGSPVVGDGFGDAAELDDGELGGEPALEGFDAATELGNGHGIASAGENSHG